MDDFYHVYLDNTNAPNTVPNIFKWVGPQNWYIVKAKDVNHAKSIVLALFQHHGDAVMKILSGCLSATKVSAIYNHLKTPNINLWSYISHGNYRQPGQQTRYPSPDQIAKTDREGHSVSRDYVPPKPVVPAGQDDTNVTLGIGEVGAEDVKIVNKKPQQGSSELPANMDPQQMMAMMQQMMATMAAMQGQPQQNTLPQDEVNNIQDSRPITQDPELQQELARKMQNIITKPRGEDISEEDDILGADLDISKIDY